MKVAREKTSRTGDIRTLPLIKRVSRHLPISEANPVGVDLGNVLLHPTAGLIRTHKFQARKNHILLRDFSAKRIAIVGRQEFSGTLGYGILGKKYLSQCF